MHYVYVLRSTCATQNYIGMTSNLRQRVKEHRAGRSITTNRYLPMELIYYEAFLSAQDAQRRERQLKQFGGAYRALMKRLNHTLEVRVMEGRGDPAPPSVLSGTGGAG